MKLIMENWRKFLTEEWRCADGSTPSKAIGGDYLICRGGAAAAEQDHAEPPADPPDPENLPPGWELMSAPPLEVDTPMAVPPTIIDAAVAYGVDREVFSKYWEKAERNLRRRQGLDGRIHSQSTNWGRRKNYVTDAMPHEILIAMEAAKLMKDDVRSTAKDISKEFKYAKKLAIQKVNDFKTQHLDGENAEHRLLWRQIKKDLRSLNPFN